VEQNLVALAFVAGMVAAFNPCGFAMLPAYLTLVIDPQSGGQLAAVGRALAATAAMALGFLAVFGSFGLLTVSVASTVKALWTDETRYFWRPAKAGAVAVLLISPVVIPKRRLWTEKATVVWLV
jgi:cytochrome c biogenesis protein CcdA